MAVLSFFAAVGPAMAQTEPGYAHDATINAYNPGWMAALPDSMKLSYMSIPGTHDSMALVGGDAIATQTTELATQLAAGIRVIDIRILFQFDSFFLCHGVMPEPGSFDSVMQTLETFLRQNPGETVLMRVQDATNGLGNTESFEQVFQSYWSRYSGIFWNNANHETNPTLGELRGKVVVLQNFTATASYGLNYSEFNAQDDYNFNNNWYQYTKWTEVEAQLMKANMPSQICSQGVCYPLLPGNANRLYINSLRGAGGSFPYFVASGKSDPSTGGPLLMTGETTPLFNNWPDFPRVNCFLGMCSIAFEGTNNLTFDWLLASPRTRVGIIMADFPGPGLIDAVIAANQRDEQGF